MGQANRRESVMIRLIGGVLVILALIVSCACWFQNASSSGTAAGKQREARDQFAADSDVVPFDPKRAMGYLEEICKIGPRISGTDGMAKQQELLKKHFEALGGKIEWQRFE